MIPSLTDLFDLNCVIDPVRPSFKKQLPRLARVFSGMYWDHRPYSNKSLTATRMLLQFAFACVWMNLISCNHLANADESKWESVVSRIDPSRDAVAGQWKVSEGKVIVAAAQRARLSLSSSPAEEYDLRCKFTRKTGQHSVGLIVVQNGHQVAFEVDAWGRHLAGFQNVDGKSIQDNSSRAENVRLENNKTYELTVEVRKDHLRGLLDGREISKLSTKGEDLALSDFWTMPDPQHLGLIAWECDTVFHRVEIRTHEGMAPMQSVAKSGKTEPTQSADKLRTPTPTKGSGTSNNSASKATSQAVPPRSASKITKPRNQTSQQVAKADSVAGKHVLIVIASHHFFYREYSDPRQELERAGFRVTVAAGRKAPTRPHDNSGQGSDGGVVQPDLALSEVKAADYDAVLFSGGWGASMYQYAFNGRYNDPTYNGDRAVKTEANRIINEFLAQDKYVCALCNAVSVLAWARVNGKSPLAGKRVCAPPRQAPPGVYNGRPGQPSCRWHPEVNGAMMSPAGAVGQPGTAADDVLVDGKIITGEDDISAREMGRRIVEVLSR